MRPGPGGNGSTTWMSRAWSPRSSGTLASSRSRNDVPPGPAPTMATPRRSRGIDSGGGGESAALPIALGDLLAHDRDDVLAEVDGVGQRVVAPRRQDLDAEVVVVEQGGGHRLR